MPTKTKRNKRPMRIVGETEYRQMGAISAQFGQELASLMREVGMSAGIVCGARFEFDFWGDRYSVEIDRIGNNILDSRGKL